MEAVQAGGLPILRSLPPGRLGLAPQVHEAGAFTGGRIPVPPGPRPVHRRPVPGVLVLRRQRVVGVATPGGGLAVVLPGARIPPPGGTVPTVRGVDERGECGFPFGCLHVPQFCSVVAALRFPVPTLRG